VRRILRHLRAFVFSDPAITVKVVFDNVRNYAIAFALFAPAILLSSNEDINTLPETWAAAVKILLMMPGVTLVLLNFWQTCEIYARVFKSLDRHYKIYRIEVAERKSWWRRELGTYGVMLYTFLCSVIFWLVVLTIIVGAGFLVTNAVLRQVA
jgi:hypothetical protein